MHRIMLDTDIGTDVDDLLALAMVPGRPDIDLAAVRWFTATPTCGPGSPPPPVAAWVSTSPCAAASASR